MKALLLSQYRKLELTDVPVPTPGRAKVLIRVAACGICGSGILTSIRPSGDRKSKLDCTAPPFATAATNCSNSMRGICVSSAHLFLTARFPEAIPNLNADTITAAQLLPTLGSFR